ncbi:unnamed protein product [Cyclocybe aegerita]|uniref:Uncharacterized protein n=1 Tax=Cyclocybe aegerita TaxID=1973307 RepID=A0A8S0VZ12_CYCAE|nr:unnamed protein product [Cyclocybe aegerita]
MGQYWTWINLDKIDQTMGKSMGKFGEACWSPTDVLLFLRPPPRPMSIELRRVPPEPEDNYRLRVKEMEEMVERFNRYSYSPGSWAGDRIILLGDYAADYPPSLTLRDIERVSNICEVNDIEVGSVPPISHERRAKMTPEELATEEAENAARNVYRMMDEVASPYQWDRDRYDNGRLKVEDYTAFPKQTGWVLRNLTKRVYVRSNGIPYMPNDSSGNMEYYHYPKLEGTPGLSQVLYMRCAWSTDNSMAIMYEGNPPLHRGLWASDRFDVVPLEDTAEVLRDEGWEDVTRELAKEMYEIYKAQYGRKVYPAWVEEPESDEESNEEASLVPVRVLTLASCPGF